MTRGLRLTLGFVSLAAIVVLGQLREFVFVNVNYQLKYLYYEQAQSYAHSFFDFLEQYSYSELYYSKWWLTGVFTLLFLVNTLLIIRFFYPGRFFLKWTFFTFGAIMLLSAAALGIGYLLSDVDQWYAISRKLMGIAHSPIVAMLLLLGFRLVPEKDEEPTS